MFFSGAELLDANILSLFKVNVLLSPHIGLFIVVLATIIVASPFVIDYINDRKSNKVSSFEYKTGYDDNYYSMAQIDDKYYSDEESMLIPKLKAAVMILTVLSVLIPAIFLFLIINYEFYIVFSVLTIAIPAITFGLYIKYNNYLSMADIKKVEDTFQYKKINICFPLLFPSLALLFRSAIDINILDYRKLIVLSTISIVIISILFFNFSNEYRYAKSSIYVLFLVALIYFPPAIAQINCIFDSSEPVITEAQVIKKHISSAQRTPDTFNLKVKLSNGKEKNLVVDKKLYNTTNEGEIVQVAEWNGLFGIKYADVYGID